MMNIGVLNHAIRAMCNEVTDQDRDVRDWRLIAEEELLYETAICIFGSQLLFEMAVAIANLLRNAGLLRPQPLQTDRIEFESLVAHVLSKPIAIAGHSGAVRWIRPRFKNRLATLLASTITSVYGNKLSIRGLLFSAGNAKEAREILIQRIWGFGPKQASLFLRRVGYCADLAVLDVHVLDYLYLARGISATPSRLGRLSFYEEIEETFREVAADFGHSLGCVDLATWVTMRVAKREAYL